MARTIDNLGLDTSTRYAKDQELFDETFIKDARRIPSQTRITVTQASFGSELDELFDLGKQGTIWAAFIAPPGYGSLRRRLFSEQIIPSLGPPDKQEAQLQRVEALAEKEKSEHPLHLEEADIEKEKETLLNLLKKIHLYDEYIIDSNSKRAQYQKG